MILLDTTVLVYATGGAHPLQEPARAIIDAIGDGRIAATTTVEVVQEFAYVRARRSGRAEAAYLATRFAALLQPLLVVEAQHLTAGLALWTEHDSLGSFDAVLAAVALSAGTALVSADAAFAEVAGLTHLGFDAVATQA